MGSLEEFEPLLKEVVSAKRLSASKMTRLTDISLKSMEYDTQLVSTLYRTHKSLSPSAKISSLYVFDALARAARSQVNKHGLTADPNSGHGNSATFLLKIEGILDGLFQDMVLSTHPESKEKTKKILDIWSKSSTFPSAVLARLSKVLKGSGEKDIHKVAQSTDPRHPQSAPTVKTPPQAIPPQSVVTPASDPQTALLALLNQAASAVASANGQTGSNSATLSSIPTPQLNANQLALFQQLTQAAKAGVSVPTQPVTVPVSLVPSSATPNVPPVAPSHGVPSQPLPYRDDHFGPGRRDPQYDRFNGPERGRDRDEYHDERHDYRGDYRGGFRGGPRGRGRGRWDDRDRFKESRDRDWNVTQRNRRSRSRSPPRNRPGGGKREVRPYSPPRRPSVSHMSASPPHGSRGRQSSLDNDKDEFGRDIRPQSPEQSKSPPQAQTAAAQSPPPPRSTPGSLTEEAQEKKQQADQAVASTSQAPSNGQPEMGIETQSAGSDPGLDAFDMTSFNPTDPSSWEALGKAWTVSNGSVPSQEDLMQYVMSGSMMSMFGMTGQYDTQMDSEQWSGQDQSWGYSQQWDGARGRGRGGFNNRGHGRGGYSGGGNYGQRDTDAITLGGGDDQGAYESGHEKSWQDRSAQEEYIEHSQTQDKEPDSAGSTGGRAGRMQRIGDKWVFVRSEAVEASDTT